MRIYAIGDIHGQLDMLVAAHRLIAEDRARCRDHSAPVVHLGDFTDRGPDSAGVIQFMIDGQVDRQPWISIKGNHDRMFAGFLRDPGFQDPRLRADLIWQDPRLGGDKTLASYGIDTSPGRTPAQMFVEAMAKVPASHRAFLDGLHLMHETDDLLFVHAGIRPGVRFDRQIEDDLVWIRDSFLEDTRDHGRIIVHGHTVFDVPTHMGNRIAIDTGAGYYQPLTAVVFEGPECWVLGAGGRVALMPETSV